MKAALIAIALTLAFILFVPHGSTQPKASATYTANLQEGGMLVVNPADLQVFAEVKNTSNVAGTPSCTIDAQDDSGKYAGAYVVIRDSPLAPGGVWDFSQDVTITHQGAAYVTAVKVTCE